ncbi:MAG: GC-type dockerin domain-anchored protein [Phycisphaerales bacterium]
MRITPLRTPFGPAPWMVLAAGHLVLPLPCARADVLHSSGPIITNPTGGTGAIAGQPISQADPFTIPGSSFNFSTTGVAATHATSTAAADDFTIPSTVGGWNLDAVTLYAFQTSQTTATIHTIRVNLWTAPPYSANSPPPVPNPLPQPVLVESLVLPAGPGTFVCHRQSASSTSSVRPVFAYTVSLNGLPDGGYVPQGTYWLQWSFDGAASPSANVFMPLVSPRTAVTGHNARLLNSLDGSSTGERVWFEGREGYVEGQAEGRAYALPFELHGTALPPPSCYVNCDASTQPPVINVQDFGCFLTRYAAGDPYANCDISSTPPILNVQDFACFLEKYAAGCP